MFSANHCENSNIWSLPPKSLGKSVASTESDSVQTSKTEQSNPHNERSQANRMLLLKSLNIDKVLCMITGIEEDVLYVNNMPAGNRVQLAHIIPHACKKKSEARHASEMWPETRRY